MKIRIVKDGAEWTMSKPENPFYKNINSLDKNSMRMGLGIAWQEGFDAAIKYLSEPCTEHKIIEWRGCAIEYYEPHRYLCPECMSELKSEVEK